MTNKRRKIDYCVKIHKRIDFERNQIENKRNIKKIENFSILTQ